MVASGKQAPWFFVLMALLVLIPGTRAKGEVSRMGSTARDSLKIRMNRERALLMRTIEELNLSLAPAKETTAMLEEQAGVLNARVPKDMENHLRNIRKWYQNYRDWLGRILEKFENDLAEHYSRRQAAREWTGPYEEMTKGYQGLAAHLAGTVREIEEDQREIETQMQKLGQFVREHRLPVEKENLELLKDLLKIRDRDTGPYNYQEAAYLDLTDEEVEQLQHELSTLSEQQQYLEILTEVGRYELSWLTLKSGDSAALDAMARVIGGDSPIPIRDASRDVVMTYESDIEALEKRVNVIHGKLHSINKTGTMKMLDLLEELSRHYEKLKMRFEHHIGWLKGQIGSYKADIVELEREY